MPVLFDCAINWLYGLKVHLAYMLAFDGRLHLAPIATNPQHVLDVGTGRGEWAIDFAE